MYAGDQPSRSHSAAMWRGWRRGACCRPPPNLKTSQSSPSAFLPLAVQGVHPQPACASEMETMTSADRLATRRDAGDSEVRTQPLQDRREGPQASGALRCHWPDHRRRGSASGPGQARAVHHPPWPRIIIVAACWAVCVR
jgi:hypothetical protein